MNIFLCSSLCYYFFSNNLFWNVLFSVIELYRFSIDKLSSVVDTIIIKLYYDDKCGSSICQFFKFICMNQVNQIIIYTPYISIHFYAIAIMKKQK